jgi:hypothetical protein
MSTWSKFYPVKSNAARAAAKYCLTRADLVQDEYSGAWRFMIPDAGQESAQEAATEPVQSPATEQPAAVADAPTVPAPETASAPKGWDAVEPGPEQGVGAPQPEAVTSVAEPAQVVADQPAVRAATAKVARRTGKVAKVNAKKREKVAKVAKVRKPRTGKVKREGHGKFSGSPAFQGRRTAQGRRGIMDKVEAMLRAKWCVADAILKETGWVSNTFRGVLGKFRRDGMDVRCEKRDGVTCYRIARDGEAKKAA